MGALVILYKKRKGKNQFNCDKDKIDFSLFYFKLIQNNMCAMITTPRSPYYAHKIWPDKVIYSDKKIADVLVYKQHKHMFYLPNEFSENVFLHKLYRGT